MKYCCLVLIIFIQGCAVSYDCNLGYECQDSMEALSAAQENAGDSERALYENEDPRPLKGGAKGTGSRGHGHSKHSDVKGEIIKFGKQNYQAKPIYVPDAPMRVWISPVKLGDVLVGDYYIFTAVRGGFSVGVGDNKAKAVGLGQYGPLDKNKELGFTPVVSGERNKVLPR